MTDDIEADPLSERHDDGDEPEGWRTNRTRRGVLALILLAISSGIIWLVDKLLPGGYGVGGYGGGGFGN